MSRLVPVLLGIVLAIGLAVAIAVSSRGPDETQDLISPAPRADAHPHEGLNAVAWTQTSAEYAAAARQAYVLATLMLDRALEDRSWTAAQEQGDNFGGLRPAVILDVDETVLDNSPHQARSVLDDVEFNRDDWHVWVREEQAVPVPGALEFTQYAASRNVRVFYVTNRRHEVEEPTRRNLAAYGFPLEDDVDTLLTRDERPDWTGEKGTRRAIVAADHRVLMLIGDNLGDFVDGVNVSVEERAAIVERHAGFWGERWIVLPNPQYGSWDGALIGYQYGLPVGDKRRIKREALDPAR